MLNSSYPSGYMSLWLKAENYSVPQVNQLPTVLSAISVLSSWFGTTLAGIYPSWVLFSIPMLAGIFSSICMTIWSIPTALKYVQSFCWPYWRRMTDFLQICRMVRIWTRWLLKSYRVFYGKRYLQERCRRARAGNCKSRQIHPSKTTKH